MVSIPLSLMRTAILQCVLISVIVTVMVVLKICLENGAVRQKMTLNADPNEVHARTPIAMTAGVHLRRMNGTGNRNASGRTAKYTMETTAGLSPISLLPKRRYLMPQNLVYLRRLLRQGRWPVVLVMANVIARARSAPVATATETAVISPKDRRQMLLLHLILLVLQIV